MDQSQFPDFAKIMKIAQQVASKIDPPPELKSGRVLTEDEMNNAIKSLAKSVTDVVTPDMFEMGEKKKKGKQMPIIKENSKISFKEEETPAEEGSSSKKTKKSRVVEIDSDCSEELDSAVMRTKDMAFTLTVKLEELYNGTRKKLAIRRQKIGEDNKCFEEKKKLAIVIEPGMTDNQSIRFNRMSDEKTGYETGDVVVTLDVEDHPYFLRDGNNLLIEKEISLAEAYNPVVYIEHLNGKTLKITGEALNVFSDEDTMLKKVPGCGMPILGERNQFGDMFIKFKCVNKTKITPEIIEVLNGIFPPLLTVPEVKETDLLEKKFEMVTESDLEFLESDSEDYDSESDEDYSDSEESE